MKEGSVIANGLDFAPDYYLARKPPGSFGRKAGSRHGRFFSYGSIGRWRTPKNYEFLINAHLEFRKSNPMPVCPLIGEGPERLKYEGSSSHIAWRRKSSWLAL
jgi:hypothetical protein